MLPIAMLAGLLFHDAIDAVAFLAPYLIFTMLLITFCKVDFRHFRVTKMTWLLLAVQVVGALGVYFALLPLNRELAQGAFICVFCPTATAAPVITGMLGGNIQRLVTYSLISNAAVALLAPVFFAMMGESDLSLLEGSMSIARKVVPLILAPLAVAVLIKRTVPGAHQALATHQGISFYLWSVSLIILVGRATSFVISEPADMVGVMVALAVVSLVVCVLQFVAGRRIGGSCGDKIAGAQGLGQKNTVLAIWMALTYLDPVSSVAPAAYVAWQNTINSLQIYFKMRRGQR